MSDVANAPMDLANNSELIADLARFSEGVLTETQNSANGATSTTMFGKPPTMPWWTRWKPSGFAVSALVAPRVKRRKTWRYKHRISWEP